MVSIYQVTLAYNSQINYNNSKGIYVNIKEKDVKKYGFRKYTIF